MRAAVPVSERLAANLAPCPDEGCECMLWQMSLDSVGYGRLWIGSRKDGTRRMRRAHLVAWEEVNGPVPAGLVIDHVHARGCRHRSCANIDHLEPVTYAVNRRRYTETITHCPSNHEYTDANTMIGPNDGKRYCRTCSQEKYLARRNPNLAGLPVGYRRPCG